MFYFFSSSSVSQIEIARLASICLLFGSRATASSRGRLCLQQRPIQNAKWRLSFVRCNTPVNSSFQPSIEEETASGAAAEASYQPLAIQSPLENLKQRFCCLQESVSIEVSDRCGKKSRKKVFEEKSLDQDAADNGFVVTTSR